jgi:hypothetical protein
MEKYIGICRAIQLADSGAINRKYSSGLIVLASHFIVDGADENEKSVLLKVRSRRE